MGKAQRAKQKHIEDQQREAHALEAKRANRKETIKITIAVIAVLLVIALVAASCALIVNAVKSTGNYLRDRVGLSSEHYQFNNAMMSYYFRNALTTWYSNMYSNLYTQLGPSMMSYYSSMLPDLTRPLRDQTSYADQSLTWYAYFMNTAISDVTSMLVLAEAADDAGLSIDDEDRQLIDHQIDTMTNAAEEQGISFDKFLNENYGLGVKESDIRDVLELYYLSRKFYYKQYNEIEVTDQEIADKLAEDPDAYNVVDYKYYRISKSDDNDNLVPAKTFLNADTPEKFDEAIRSVLSEDDTKTDEDIEAAIKSATVNNASPVEDSDASTWLFSSERKAGDTKMFTDESTGAITVYLLVTPSHLNESETYTVRHILFSYSSYETEDEAREAAQEIFDQYNAGDKTEESFASLARLYSMDTGSAANGGKYENVTIGSMVEEFEDWSVDAKRKAGDVEMIETDYGVHIMYYVGKGRPAYAASIFETLRTEKYTDIAETLTNDHPVNVDSNKLKNIPDIA